MDDINNMTDMNLGTEHSNMICGDCSELGLGDMAIVY